MKKNLILTGMLGVGKSTIGRLLAIKLNLNFLDVDKIIEKEQGLLIKEIFETKGEDNFRAIEKKTSLKLLEKHSVVVALGGGAFMDKDIRNKVLKSSISFWLNASLQTLIDRASSSDKRPLLNNENIGKKLSEIYENRKDIYCLANYKINCDKLSKTIIINEISKIYEQNRD